MRGHLAARTHRGDPTADRRWDHLHVLLRRVALDGARPGDDPPGLRLLGDVEMDRAVWTEREILDGLQELGIPSSILCT